ncbi:MAG: bifunctional phosphoglucose/phosphomannose isomerase [Thermoleophilia bacterium]
MGETQALEGEGRGAERSADLGPEQVAAVDRSDLLGAIAGLPRQLTAGYAAARRSLRAALAEGAAPAERPAGVVICGMGGSAIGADLVLACLPELPVPAAVVRGYELPAWAGPETLVIAVSYSGGTEETLACATAALTRGATPVCVASGGRLAALAGEHSLPLVLVPGGGQPRAAVGALAMPLLAALEAAGLCAAAEGDVDEAAAVLRAAGEGCAPEAGAEANPAKRLARALFRRLLVVYGAGLTVPAARRWKGQVNENAKAPAFWNELPELDHNELMGWSSLPPVSAATTAVFLEDAAADPRLRRRAELTAAEVRRHGLAVEMVTARGASRLARLFSLVQLGDYVSFYLAVLYGVDPTPVTAIEEFKAELAGAGG